MDVGALVGTSGPLAVLAAIAGFFLKVYLEKRKGDRQDRKTDRESESGIVETTKETLRIVRKQMVQMDAEAYRLRSRLAELETLLHAKDTETEDLRSRLAELETRLHATDKGAELQTKGRTSFPIQRSAPSDDVEDPPNSGLQE